MLRVDLNKVPACHHLQALVAKERVWYAGLTVPVADFGGQGVGDGRNIEDARRTNDALDESWRRRMSSSKGDEDRGEVWDLVSDVTALADR
eukprot:757531-Hanusia_phi.AAC.3